MRDELESLKKIIEPKILRMSGIKKGKLILKEPKNLGTEKLSQVTLFNLPDETVVFTLDQPKARVSGYLAETKGGWNKGCDYVIATHDGKVGWMLICEMKSGSSPTGFITQLQSTDAFVTYLDALIRYFGKGRLESYRRRHVLFYQPPVLQKRPFTAGQLTVKQTEKLNLLKVDKNVLQIDELFIGG